MVERIGSVCTINGKDAYTQFDADLKELAPVVGSIAASFAKAMGASSLSVFDYKIETGGLTMIFYVGGETKEACYINTSNLIAECQSCIIRTNEDSFEYAAVLTECKVAETGIEFYNEATLTFAAVKRLPMAAHSFAGGNGTFKNIGSVESGMRLTITPKEAMDAVTVNGITINGLTTDPFIIDGLIGEVMCNGVNKFLSTDLIEFPKVLPGDNTVTSSSDRVTVKVEYYPTFIV